MAADVGSADRSGTPIHGSKAARPAEAACAQRASLGGKALSRLDARGGNRAHRLVAVPRWRRVAPLLALLAVVFALTGTSAAFAQAPAGPQAELAVGLGVSNTGPVVGEPVTFTFSVINGGPDTATGVVIASQIPEGFSFLAADAPCTVDGTGRGVTCPLPSALPADPQPRVLRVIAMASQAIASTSMTATAFGNEADPALENNTATATLSVRPAVPTAPVPPALPPAAPVTTPAPAPTGTPTARRRKVARPVPGKSADAATVSGTVRVRINGVWKTLGPGETIPMGTTVDTRAGVVEITSAADASGTPQTAQFGEGMFVLNQTN